MSTNKGELGGHTRLQMRVSWVVIHVYKQGWVGWSYTSTNKGELGGHTHLQTRVSWVVTQSANEGELGGNTRIQRVSWVVIHVYKQG